MSQSTVFANLNAKGLAQDERQALLEFWLKRYQDAPDMRVTDTFHNKPVRGAGGEGLFVSKFHPDASIQLSPNDPDHPVNIAFSKRQYELKNQAVAAPKADRDRLKLLEKVELSSHEHWKNQTLSENTTGPEQRYYKKKSAQLDIQLKENLGQLMTYDRQHQHPVAEPRRNVKTNPLSSKEQYDWLNRDHRLMDSSERSNVLSQNLDLVYGDKIDIKLDPKLSHQQPWFIDNQTMGMVKERFDYEKHLDQEFKKNLPPGVPLSDVKKQDIKAIEDAQPQHQNLVKTKQQLSYIQSENKSHLSSQEIIVNSIKEAARVDPEFSQKINDAASVSKENAQLVFKSHLDQVQKRFDEVNQKVDENNTKILPFRSSDVVLLRAQNQAQQIQQGLKTETQPNMIVEAAHEGKQSGLSKETVKVFSEKLQQRRDLLPQKDQPELLTQLQAAASKNEQLKSQLHEVERTNNQLQKQVEQKQSQDWDRGRFDRIRQMQQAEHQSVRQSRLDYEKNQLGDLNKRMAPAYEDIHQFKKSLSIKPNKPKIEKTPNWWEDIKQKALEFKNNSLNYLKSSPQVKQKNPDFKPDTQQARAAISKSLADRQVVIKSAAAERVKNRPQVSFEGNNKRPQERGAEVVLNQSVSKPKIDMDGGSSSSSRTSSTLNRDRSLSMGM